MFRDWIIIIIFVWVCVSIIHDMKPIAKKSFFENGYFHFITFLSLGIHIVFVLICGWIHICRFESCKMWKKLFARSSQTLENGAFFDLRIPEVEECWARHHVKKMKKNIFKKGFVLTIFIRTEQKLSRTKNGFHLQASLTYFHLKSHLKHVGLTFNILGT